MSVHEIRHPLIRHKLGLMRSADLSTRSFRQLASEVGCLLTYEATKDLELEPYQVDGWCGPVTAERIKGKKITVVPILRAGIGIRRFAPVRRTGRRQAKTGGYLQCLHTSSLSGY